MKNHCLQNVHIIYCEHSEKNQYNYIAIFLGGKYMNQSIFLEMQLCPTVTKLLCQIIEQELSAQITDEEETTAA